LSKFVLPHMYLFFGIILFILAEFVVPISSLYRFMAFISIVCIIVGLLWNIILLFIKRGPNN